ncbi:MAG: Na+-transporting NADH:ubiquinone oxidoreductase subunit F, partial [Bacteroidia bacterium]
MGAETLTVVISALAAFTLIILLLVSILLFARSKLVQSGDVQIIINGDEANPRIVPAGSTLLTTLSSEKL